VESLSDENIEYLLKINRLPSGGELSSDKKLDLYKKLPHYPKNKNEHDALSDAKWNLELFHFIKDTRHELLKLNLSQ
jgi:hypothetical protein